MNHPNEKALQPTIRLVALVVLAVVAAYAYAWHRAVSAQSGDKSNGVGEVPSAATNGKIAFQRGFGATAHVIVVDSGGVAESDYGVGQDPSWRSDGTKILFNTNSQLWLMNADGSNRQMITDQNGAAISGEFASWSPDGAKVVFVRNNQTGFPGNVLKMAVDVSTAKGTNQVQLTSSGSDSYPAWQPAANGQNGGFIAFQRSVSSNAEIFTMNASDGSNQTNITNNAASDRNPNWFTDGSKIIFASLRAAPNNGDIWTMSPTGSGLAQLTSDTFEDGYPAYSPDGTKIVWSSGSGRNGTSNDKIFTMNADGSGVFGPISLTSSFDTNPSWQPITALPHIATFSKSGPPCAGDSITFGAGTDAGLAVRIQSTTTPNNEGSWTDLPDGNGGKMHEDSPGNYSLTTTAYPITNGIYFRAISSKSGLTDGKSDVLGPFDLATLPHIATFSRNGPTSPGGSILFNAGTCPGLSVRVQSSTTPANEGSWSDLPDGNGGKMHEDSAGNYSLTTTAYPFVNGINFRAVSSKNGFSDGKSDVLGPFNLQATISDLELRFNPNSAPPTTIHLGQMATYSILVNNNGPSKAFGVSVSGNVPPNTSVDPSSSSFCATTGFGATFTCSLGDLDASPTPHATSGTGVIIFNLVLKPRAPGSITLTPSAGLDTSKSTDNVPSNNSTTTTTFVLADVALIGLEVTQGVQNLYNSIPLVAGKRTFVRAHVKALTTGSNGVMASASLTAKRSGVPIGTIGNSNVGGSIKVIQSPKRVNPDDSFYFELPSDWTSVAGNIQFTFAGNEFPFGCNAVDGSTDCSVIVNFQTRRKFSIRFFKTTFIDGSGNKYTPSDDDLIETMTEIRANFPMADFASTSFYTWSTKQEYCTAGTANPKVNGIGNLLQALKTMRASDCAPDLAKTKKCRSGVEDFYFVLVPDPAASGTSFCSNIEATGLADSKFDGPTATLTPETGDGIQTDNTGNNAIGIARMANTRTHELGHNFGLRHTTYTAAAQQTGGPDDTSLTKDGSISPDSKLDYDPATVFGFDPLRETITGLDPSWTTNNGYFNKDGTGHSRVYDPTTGDMMSYASPAWISAYKYKRLFNALAPPSGGVPQADPSPMSDSEAPIQTMADKLFLIDGSISFTDGTGVIGNVFTVNSPGTVTLPPPGGYALRFDDSVGNQLASYSFDVSQASEGNTGTFSLFLPKDPNARRIVLLHSGQVLATRQASANPPAITVVSPNGGEILSGSTANFTWSASDADGDVLTYAVEYSRDASASWTMLTSNWNSTTYPVDLTELPASNKAMIRVTATDGFNSTQAQSSGTFTVPEHAPVTGIISPTDGRLYVGSQTIVLQGTGFDVEDGLLPDSQLTWISNLDGALGTGSSLTVNASSLQEGTHTITLRGADSTGRTGERAITVRVARTAPIVSPSLSLSNSALNFSTQVGGGLLNSQNISLRTLGNGELSWSATADQSWIKLSSAAGSTPAELQVAVDGTGLAAGSYNGKVTITAAGATNSPLMVTVNLVISSVPRNMQFSGATYTAAEGDGKTSITVTRTGDTSGAASVRYATSDGTAKEGKDYTSAFGVLNFAAGETSKTFPVLIIDNAFAAGARTVNLTLINPIGATLAAQSTAVLSISDNDASTGTTNPIDTPRFFVQEHYYDFLGRYPDQSGWDFWTNEIASCGNDQTCIGLKRINVSAAYFLSIEFQQTGYLVERIYKTAYGSGSGMSTFGGTHQFAVPVVHFNEFLPDTQLIGSGVVVGATGWETVLENNKRAFTNDFVQRSRFATAFPTTMTPAQFVDKLNTNAGNVLLASDRSTAIALFGSATDTSNTNARAQAVRQVAENATLNTQEFNRAFVLMQFFGYLRRDPNSGQDTDYTGFDFWLTKLNAFNGNFVNAEMVKAFITSTEYRQRFGP